MSTLPTISSSIGSSARRCCLYSDAGPLYMHFIVLGADTNEYRVQQTIESMIRAPRWMTYLLALVVEVEVHHTCGEQQTVIRSRWQVGADQLDCMQRLTSNRHIYPPMDLSARPTVPACTLCLSQ